jgi:PA14 domain/Glycosyl hydrolase family 26
MRGSRVTERRIMDRREFLKVAGAGALLTAFPSTALAQSTSCAKGQYLAQYYQGQNFNYLWASQCEAAPLNKNWGTDRIAPMYRADNASARWIGDFDFESGAYKFTATADDGIRVYVDGVLIIDEWREQSATTFEVTRPIRAGIHQIKAEWFEAAGAAVCELNWTRVSTDSSPGSGVALGAHVDPWVPSLFDGYTSYANQALVKSAFITNLHSWAGPGGYEGFFPAAGFDRAYSEGYIRSPVPIWGWSPSNWAFSSSQNAAFSQDAILQGNHDAFINQVASQVASWNKRVIIRFAWEMNSNWMTWSPDRYGNTPQKYIQVWRKIVDMFRTQRATNAEWAWCPNVKGPGGTPDQRPFTDYYPGDSYVDWLGADGYNMAASNGNPWINYDVTTQAAYTELAAIHPSKPIMWGEIGCHDAPGNKAAWFTQMRNTVETRQPRLKAIAYWNRNLDLNSKIDRPASALPAYQAMATDPYFNAML